MSVSTHASDDAVCGSVSDDEMHARIHVRITTMGGDLVGSATVDADATMGQVRAKLGKPREWYSCYNRLIIGTQSFEFDECYTRIMCTKVAKANIRRDENDVRVLDAVAIHAKARADGVKYWLHDNNNNKKKNNNYNKKHKKNRNSSNSNKNSDNNNINKTTTTTTTRGLIGHMPGS